MQLNEMKTCCYILFAVVVAANYTNARPEKLEKSLDEEWEDFKTKYSKGYIVGSQEERYRKNNFVQRLLTIREHNMLFERGLTTYTKGINKFSDLTHEEMKQRHMGLKPKDLNHVPKIKQRNYVPDPNQVVPDELDWRKHGAVAKVKNQGQCGSCWAFSAVASLEGQYFKKSGKLVSMSEQNLVDCSHVNHGCQGGFVEDAYDYVYINDGIDSEKSYPYEEKDDKCRYNKKNNVTSVEYLGVVPKGNEEILKSAVAAIGPISVSIYAGDSFQDYHGNVFMGDDCYPSSISNHAVTIVGYGTTTEGLDYWLVKNSWGDDYGEDGYIRMVRNKNNKCGIASEAVYPIMY